MMRIFAAKDGTRMARMGRIFAGKAMKMGKEKEWNADDTDDTDFRGEGWNADDADDADFCG